MIDMPPVPESSTTIEGALADLAGAIFAAWNIHLEQNPNSELTEDYLLIVVALKQFENSGFVLQESYQVADNIFESYKGYK